MMTDRDMLVAIFNLMGGLALRVTGETPILCVKGEDGNMYHVYPQTNNVTWVQEEDASSLGRGRVSSAMHCPVHGGQSAMLPESLQVSEHSASGQH